MIRPESEVRVLFSLFSKKFPLEERAKTLRVASTETLQAENVISEIITDEPRFHKETVWTAGTNYVCQSVCQ